MDKKDKESELEYYLWVDKVVDILKGRKFKKNVVNGGWTPSGFFHIGNSRAELLIPSFVHQNLKESGLKSEHNFLIDDFDDFDKIPKGLDIKNEDFEPHLGKPLVNVPSPAEGFTSWADYFSNQVLSVINEFGIKPNILSSYDSYKKGLYDKAIKTVLDKSEEVRKIWNDVTKSDKPKGWIPVMIVCENCGKLSTTKVTSWNGKEVEYICNQNRAYTNACKHKGKVKPEKGRAKLPWRIHWAATWYIRGTTYETAGKDHFASGGSVETSQAFCKQIFNSEGPFQTPTEFLLVDDVKLSGSTGNVISLKDWLEFAEPELLRFMMASYKPKTVINFDLHSNKFFLLADRYDEAERVYFDKKEEKDKREKQLEKIYKFAQVDKLQDKIPVQLNYSNAAMIVQTFPDKPLSEVSDILHARGWITRKTLSTFDKNKIKKRLELAKNWLDKYAPEDIKFTVQEEVPKNLKLSLNEKKALQMLVSALKKKDWDQKNLYDEFYNICKKVGIKNTDFFKASYGVLLNKDRGPKLAAFILTLGKEKVIELFEKV
jgi:lysyl-tRNA synthetase, class I